MFKKLGLFLFILTILQVTARYKNVEPNIHPESAEVSSSSSRVISGWTAKPGQHPHHAALSMLNSTGSVQLCGGSIISKEWVITAAPCTVGCVLAVVRVGVVSINDNNPENIFETTEWYNHPMFNNLSTSFELQSHGVTLVKLQRPLVYSRLVQRIRIQSSADAYHNYDASLVYTSGFRRISSIHDTASDVLRWIFLWAINETWCRSLRPGIVHNTTICARYHDAPLVTCYDNLGGPLVIVESDGVPTLIGVSYFMPDTFTGCVSGNITGFYRPGFFLPWFKEVTGIDFENLQEENDDDTTVADTTTTTIPSTTTDSEDLDQEDCTPKDYTTLPSEDTEEDEEEEGPDSSRLLKHREANVKVKVLTNIQQM